LPVPALPVRSVSATAVARPRAPPAVASAASPAVGLPPKARTTASRAWDASPSTRDAPARLSAHLAPIARRHRADRAEAMRTSACNSATASRHSVRPAPVAVRSRRLQSIRPPSPRASSIIRRSAMDHNRFDALTHSIGAAAPVPPAAPGRGPPPPASSPRPQSPPYRE
jgi:hypothetical protein